MVEDVFGIIGTTLAGTFHIEEVIAEGGYGVVYRAEHVAFRAPVALKCLKIPGTVSPSQSEVFVENFREEAEILFHLSAQIPEVVRPLHADAMTLTDGTFVPYIAMEWVDGRPLDSIIIMREDDGLKPLDPRTVVKMLTPIAHALSRAHRFQVPGGAVVSVAHCDLKPENILITERDSPVRAKILDFGIANARDAVRQNVGRITGSEDSRPFTPSYGAPEQWVPKRLGQSGPWTDVWGLALTMVECVTGHPPIDGDMHAMMGTALDKTHRPTPRGAGIAVDDAVERVFQKALAVDPRQRYQSIEAFWTAIEGAVSVASSFERARERDSDQGYAPGAPRDRADSQEFDGLELESEAPAPAAQAPLEAPAGVPGPPDLEIDAPAPPAPVPPRGPQPSELDLEEEPDEDEPPPGGFDLDLDVDEPAPPSLRDPAPASVDGGPPSSEAPPTSGGERDSQLAPSDARPALTSSGAHPAMARSGTHPALGKSGPHRVADDEHTGAMGGLAAQLKTPVILVGIGLALTLVDMVLARSIGDTLSLGPVRLRWIAATLAAVGIVLAFWNLVGDRE